jgi:hypothetical protein
MFISLLSLIAREQFFYSENNKIKIINTEDKNVSRELIKVLKNIFDN